jgi:hypothetical protein
MNNFKASLKIYYRSFGSKIELQPPIKKPSNKTRTNLHHDTIHSAVSGTLPQYIVTKHDFQLVLQLIDFQISLLVELFIFHAKKAETI